MTKKLGFIGLGNMGSRLSKNLSEDNGSITAWNRNKDRAKKNAPKQAKVAGSLEEVVKESDIIFSCLSEDIALKTVFHEIISFDIKDKIFIDFSTVSPETSIDIAKKIIKHGAKLLDAALSGSTPQVEARQLTIIVGGEKAVYEECKSYLKPLAKNTFYIGENGKGLKMKLCINALLAIGIQALGESIALGQKLSIDKSTLIDVLSNTAVVSPSQKAKMENIAHDSYNQVTFALELMYKDLGLILEQAHKTATPMPATAAAEQVAAIGIAKGLNSDFSVSVKTNEQLASLKQ